jgi:hypothetical protein
MDLELENMENEYMIQMIQQQIMYNNQLNQMQMNGLNNQNN